MITAILMASGFGRRFQTDKLLLDFHGKPVLSRVMESISSCPFSEKLLITQSPAHAILAKDYGFIPHINEKAITGQTASIKLGISLAPHASAYMFFVGDQPYMNADVIHQLLAAHEKYKESIIVPTVNGKFRNPVIFPTRFRNELLALEGDTGGREIINTHLESIQTIAFETPLPFMDMDTPKEYQWLLSQTI